MTKIINLARELAKNAHKGQKRSKVVYSGNQQIVIDGEGDDYFDAHVQKVVDHLRENNNSLIPRGQWNDQRLQDIIIATAYLHDVVEDTVVTLDMIESLFGPLVRDMVDVLTKRNNETYFDFIMRINDCGSITVPCRAIKIADISCNMADATEVDKLGSRYAKYELARYILRYSRFRRHFYGKVNHKPPLTNNGLCNEI